MTSRALEKEARAEGQGKVSEVERKAGSKTIHFLKDLLGRVEIAQKRACDQPRGDDKAERGAICEHFAERAAGCVGRKGALRADDKVSGWRSANQTMVISTNTRNEPEDRPPIGHQENRLAIHRGDDGHEDKRPWR